jgi:hypothetical protein
MVKTRKRKVVLVKVVRKIKKTRAGLRQGCSESNEIRGGSRV